MTDATSKLQTLATLAGVRRRYLDGASTTEHSMLTVFGFEPESVIDETWQGWTYIDRWIVRGNDWTVTDIVVRVILGPNTAGGITVDDAIASAVRGEPVECHAYVLRIEDRHERDSDPLIAPTPDTQWSQPYLAYTGPVTAMGALQSALVAQLLKERAQR